MSYAHKRSRAFCEWAVHLLRVTHVRATYLRATHVNARGGAGQGTAIGAFGFIFREFVNQRFTVANKPNIDGVI